MNAIGRPPLKATPASYPTTRPSVVPVTWSSLPGASAYGRPIEVHSILVVKADHIGDLILGLDAMLVVRRAFPEAHITLACGPWNAELARSLGIFDDVVGIDFFDAHAERGRDDFSPSMLNDLAGQRFDVAIDLRVDPDTRVILRHVEAPFRFGFESAGHNDIMTMFLPHRVDATADRNLGVHQGLLMLRLAHSVVDFLKRSPDSDALLRDRVARAGSFDLDFAIGRTLIAVNTSSGRLAKNWPIKRYAEIILWLADTMGAAVVLLGTGEQVADYNRIVEQAKSGLVRSAAGRTTMAEAIDLVTRTSMYVGNDTGLTHIAARLGIPTIAIYSGIDPTAMWASIGPDVTIVKAPVACSPCHILQIADCHHNHVCIRAIDVDTVRALIGGKLLGCAVYDGIQDSKLTAARAAKPILAR